MTAKQTALDRKARRALMLLGVMLLLVVVLAMWSFIARMNEQNALPIPMSPDERLVVIDRQMMIVPPEGLGKVMTDWLNSGQKKTLSFELSDRSFQTNSPTPAAITTTRVRQVARLTKASPTLTVHILEPTNVGSVAIRRLDERRAERLRESLVANGVTQSHVTIEDEQDDLPFAKSPYLAVLLSK
jgi:hypothetical protein